MPYSKPPLQSPQWNSPIASSIENSSQSSQGISGNQGSDKIAPSGMVTRVTRLPAKCVAPSSGNHPYWFCQPRPCQILAFRLVSLRKIHKFIQPCNPVLKESGFQVTVA